MLWVYIREVGKRFFWRFKMLTEKCWMNSSFINYAYWNYWVFFFILANFTVNLVHLSNNDNKPIFFYKQREYYKTINYLQKKKKKKKKILFKYLSLVWFGLVYLTANQLWMSYSILKFDLFMFHNIHNYSYFQYSVEIIFSLCILLVNDCNHLFAHVAYCTTGQTMKNL